MNFCKNKAPKELILEHFSTIYQDKIIALGLKENSVIQDTDT